MKTEQPEVEVNATPEAENPLKVALNAVFDRYKAEHGEQKADALLALAKLQEAFRGMLHFAGDRNVPNVIRPMLAFSFAGKAAEVTAEIAGAFAFALGIPNTEEGHSGWEKAILDFTRDLDAEIQRFKSPAEVQGEVTERKIEVVES